MVSPKSVNLNLNLNVNEFIFYINELAGTSKKIFSEQKMLPDCNSSDCVDFFSSAAHASEQDGRRSSWFNLDQMSNVEL